MLEYDILNLVIYFESLIIGLLLTFGFIIMLNQRLNMEIVESKKHFEHIFNSNPDAVVITREKGDLFVNCNRNYTELFGYTKKELLNKSVLDLNILKNSSDKVYINSKIEKYGFLENYEVIFQRKDGELKTGLVSAKRISLNGIPHIIRVTRDISEKTKALEKEKKYLSELKELNIIKDTLFSIIGHDLRSPFNSIIGLTSILQENISEFTTEKLKKIVDAIHDSGKNAFQLSENLLSWARTQTNQIHIKLEKVDLDDLILDTINLSLVQATGKNISLKYMQSINLSIISDKNIVSTVLRNLLTNAIKFTKSNGTISITIDENENDIEIAVSDNGIGMSEEIKKELFEKVLNEARYGTNYEKGTGLGLSICKKLIEKLSGKIWVVSEEGKGSTFTFSLPKNMSL